MSGSRLYGKPVVFYRDSDEICWNCGRTYSSPRLKEDGKYYCPFCANVLYVVCKYCHHKIELGPGVTNCVDGCGAPLTDDYLNGTD